MATKNTAAAKAASAATSWVRVRALEPIRSNGSDYAPGEVMELDPADAAPLVASGWAEMAPTTLPTLSEPLGPEVKLV